MIKEIFPETNKSYTNTISFFQELKSDNPISTAQGEFVAKSTNGKLKFYNQNQVIGGQDPKQG